jgi:hypothetical protein
MRELQEIRYIVVAGATDGPPIGSTRTDRHGARFAAMHQPTGTAEAGPFAQEVRMVKERWWALPPWRGARYSRSRWVIVGFKTVSSKCCVFLRFRPGHRGQGRRRGGRL